MRIRRILIHLLCLSGPLAAATPALAGAFLEPSGQGEAIAAASFSDSTRAFDAKGRLIPVPDYRKFELGTYIEYGLTDWLTLIVQPSADVVRQSPTQPVPSAAATTDVGARVGLVHVDSTVLSLQGLVHVPFTATSTEQGLFDQDRVPAAELSLLLGHGFVVDSAPGFFEIAASHIWQGASLPDEWQAQATVGLRPQPKLLIMMQSTMTIAGALGSSCLNWSACWKWLKLQPSIVYDLSPYWSVAASFFATVAGQNTGRELGPLLGLWYHF